MKVKELVSLILDSEADQGKNFSQLIKPIFGDIQVSSSKVEALEKFQDFKPHVIFLNLTMAQRAQNFEALEALSIPIGNPVIIFGYNDGYEPELLAHALETGINDIFTRPYDADIISSKINRFFQNDKTISRDLQYTRLSPPIKAALKLNLTLIEADENGLTFKCDHYVSNGTVIPFSGDLAVEMFHQKEIPMMITRTWISDDWKEYFLYAEVRDNKELINAELRKFILRKV